MDFLPDFLRLAMEYSEGYAKAGYSLQSSFGALNISIDKTIALVDEINNSLAEFCKDIAKRPAYKYGVLYEPKGNAIVQDHSTAIPVNNAKDKKEEGSKSIYEEGAETFEKIAKPAEFVKNALKIGESLNVLPKALGKFIKPLELIESVGTGLKGGMELLSAGQKGLSLAEGLTGLGDVLAGVSGIIEVAELASGPLGWALMAVTALAGGAMTYMTYEEGKKKKEVQSQEQTAKMLKTFEMPESSANKYVSGGDARKLAYKALHTKPHKVTHRAYNVDNPATKTRKKYGRNAYEYTPPLPQQAVDGVFAKYNLPPEVNQNANNKMPVQRTYLDLTPELRDHLWYAALTGGKEGLDKATAERMVLTMRYDKLHHTHSTDLIQAVSNDVAYQMVTTANSGKTIAIKEKRHATRSVKTATPARSNNCKCITINLNKPMIENFVINAKDGKDGLSDFKRKVEEVLIEILNNANVN